MSIDSKIKGGYYIKARQIKDSFINKSAPCTRETWDYLLREATHKKIKYDGFILKRGQVFRSYSQIRDGLAWQKGCVIRRYTVNQMKHTMSVLTKEHMITLSKQPRGMLITICNYSYFQNPKNYESTNERATSQPTNAPRANQQPLAINKNVKKEEERIKDTPETSSVTFNNSQVKNKDFSINFSEVFANINNKCTEIINLPPGRNQKYFNPKEFAQKMINQAKHPEAIYKALDGISIYWEQSPNPWAAGIKIINRENGNSNEQEAIQIHKKLKQLESPELLELSSGLFQEV